MKMSLFIVLPQLFKTGQLIIKNLEGGLNEEEIKEIVQEMRTILAQIPELAAFVSIFDIVAKVAVVVLPIFMKDKVQVAAVGFTDEQLVQAQNVAEFFSRLVDETIAKGQAAQNAVTEDDVEDLT